MSSPLSIASIAATVAASLKAGKTKVNYSPQEPTERQNLFLSLGDVKEGFYGGAAGGGKLEALTTQLVTPNGWITYGDAKVGDTIFDENGLICTITKLFDVEYKPDAYRIVFDDGSEHEAGADHQWLTYDAKELAALTRREDGWRERRKGLRSDKKQPRPVNILPNGKPDGRGRHKRPDLAECNRQSGELRQLSAPTGAIRTTQEIFNTLRTKSGRTNHAVPVAKPLQLPVTYLLIDPYCLGAWLGDGTASSGGLTGIDPNIWEEFEKCGYKVTHNPNTTTCHYVNGLVTEIKKLGIYKNKHIPQHYLRGSIEQRLSLLQGLMDTDGTVCDSGSVEFTNTNKRIIDGTYELIVSLGWKARIVEGRAKLNDTDYGPKWDIKWTPDQYVFRLPRKRNKQKLGSRRTLKFRYIVDCYPIDPVPMRCIQVDSPSHLYLTGKSMVPTHNSSCLLMAALEYVDQPGYAALILRKTYADLAKAGALMDRAHEWLNPFRSKGVRWNEQKKQWTFPSGATLTFGYLETENDKYNYQGAEYQFIGFDELTQFTKSSYTYLFSRLRRLAGSQVPVRVRSASNPGGIGANWVHERFIPEGFSPSDAEHSKVWWKESEDTGRDVNTKRAFVPARITDNPHLNRAEYEETLYELDPITREQLLRGDWMITQRGDIYPMWSEPHHVISWSQFAQIYGVKEIPSHWLRAIFMDCGTTEGHPNVTSWFTTAPENAPLAGTVFLYKGHCAYGLTVREIAEHILETSFAEKEKFACWRMSHEANSERIAFNRDFGLPFSPWKADRNRGIAQIRNFLEIRNKNTPHPFKKDLKGRPSLYLVVDDNQLAYPKDDAGLARWRAEFPAYRYKILASGQPATQVVPHPLFNDAMDTVRAAGAEYFAPMLPLTIDERVDTEMSQIYAGRTFQDILELPSVARGPAIDAWKLKHAEVRRRQEGRLIKSGIVKWRKRKNKL